MVTVDKYIRKLIFEHDCVIIPEFGGLLTHHIGAQYDSANEMMLPSRKRLAFNEVLNVDDGLLIYFISVNEKMNREDAAHNVRKYVDTLRARMQSGESVAIDSIGCFATNSEGKIVFEPEQEQNFNNDWFGFQSFKLSKKVNSRLAPVESPQYEEVSNTVETLAEQEEEVYSTASTIQWYKWLAAAMLAGVVFTASMMYKTTDSNSLLSTLNPFTGIRDILVTATLMDFSDDNEAEVVVFNESPAADFSAKEIVEIPLIEPLAAESKSTLNEQVPFQEVLSAPALSNEVTIKEEPKIVEVFKEIAPATTKTKQPGFVVESNKYYLIAGSFGKKSNALDLKRELIKNGFAGADIIEEADSKLIKVSAGTYTNMRQAMEDKYTIDSITLADSWVYHKN